MASAPAGKPDRKRKAKQKVSLSFADDDEEMTGPVLGAGGGTRKRRKKNLVNAEALAEFSAPAETTEERLRRQAGEGGPRYDADELARLRSENANHNKPPPQATAEVAAAEDEPPRYPPMPDGSESPTPPPAGTDAEDAYSASASRSVTPTPTPDPAADAAAGARRGGKYIDDPDYLPFNPPAAKKPSAQAGPPRGRLHELTQAGGKPIAANGGAGGSDEDEEEGEDLFVQLQLQRARAAYLPSLDDQPRGRGAAAPRASPVPDLARQMGDTTATAAAKASKLERNVLSLDLPSFDDQVRKLRGVAGRMRAARQGAEADERVLQQSLTVCEGNIAEYRDKAGKTTARFHVLQEMRDYFGPLAECLREKRRGIDELLEEAIASCAARHGRHAMKRRTWRVDEDREVELVVHHHRRAAAAAADADVPDHPGHAVDDVWAARSLARHVEYDTESAEGGGSEASAADPEHHRSREAFASAFAARAAALMADVDEAFGSLAVVREKVLAWKAADGETYGTAARPSLAVCFEPFVKLDLAAWDPLALAAPCLPHMPWWGALEVFAGEPAGTPEAALRRFLVQEVVVPHVQKYIAACYDPLSASQGRQVAALVKELAEELDTPEALKPVMDAVVGCARRAYEDLAHFNGLHDVHDGEEVDVALDVTGEHVIRTRTMAVAASTRRCRKATKLMGNILLLDDVLSQGVLRELCVQDGVSGVLCRHYLSHPRASFAALAATLDALADALLGLPREWLLPSDDIEHYTRTAGIRQLMDALSGAFRDLRTSQGRQAHQQMIAAAKSFKRTCDVLGDNSTIKRILG